MRNSLGNSKKKYEFELKIQSVSQSSVSILNCNSFIVSFQSKNRVLIHVFFIELSCISKKNVKTYHLNF
jgi:hypothetical protein